MIKIWRRVFPIWPTVRVSQRQKEVETVMNYNRFKNYKRLDYPYSRCRCRIGVRGPKGRVGTDKGVSESDKTRVRESLPCITVSRPPSSLFTKKDRKLKILGSKNPLVFPRYRVFFSRPFFVLFNSFSSVGRNTIGVNLLSRTRPKSSHDPPYTPSGIVLTLGLWISDSTHHICVLARSTFTGALTSPNTDVVRKEH